MHFISKDPNKGQEPDEVTWIHISRSDYYFCRKSSSKKSHEHCNTGVLTCLSFITVLPRKTTLLAFASFWGPNRIQNRIQVQACRIYINLIRIRNNTFCGNDILVKIFGVIFSVFRHPKHHNVHPKS